MLCGILVCQRNAVSSFASEYIHLSNEETNGQRSLRAARRQGLGLWVAPPLSREASGGGLPLSSARAGQTAS
jgi:hypothetical protein